MITADAYQRAERELTLREWRRGWRIHAAVYALVMTGLTILNVVLVATTDADFLWFPFPLVGWGIGVAMHYVHGVRFGEREIAARQAQIAAVAEQHAREPAGTPR
ncbi:2TM domain-containing protein [Miltoncostaea marina]|uniref:2TM domain-containing protein n=1 Tax=Miltoncostaea marina TaxID=2843215 RepID=UPI001C3DB016|nr:2TM domain-containing protein [Miltoncostaea marina]